jgi:hypothetical protein
MDHAPEPEPSDPMLRLTRDVYYVVVHTLRGALLPPVINTPEEVARRDHAAVGQVAAMLPANADEAYLAAQCVAARLYGMDCIRLAGGFAETDPMEARKCAAQSATPRPSPPRNTRVLTHRRCPHRHADEGRHPRLCRRYEGKS